MGADGLAGRVAADPLGALFACVVWIPMTVWGVLLVGWMVTKDLDFVTGLIALVAVLTLAAFTIDPPTPWLAPVSFLTLVVSLLLYPFASRLSSVRELKQVERERLLGLLEGFEANPSNHVALFRIGEALARLGLGSYGLPMAERALRSLPESHFREEHRLLSRLRAEASAPAPELRCPACSAPLPPSEVLCPRCGCNVVRHRLLSRPDAPIAVRLVVALGTTATLALLALAALPSQSQIPAGLRVAVLALTLALGVYVVYKAVSPVISAAP